MEFSCVSDRETVYPTLRNCDKVFHVLLPPNRPYNTHLHLETCTRHMIQVLLKICLVGLKWWWDHYVVGWTSWGKCGIRNVNVNTRISLNISARQVEQVEQVWPKIHPKILDICCGVICACLGWPGDSGVRRVWRWILIYICVNALDLYRKFGQNPSVIEGVVARSFSGTHGVSWRLRYRQEIKVSSWFILVKAYKTFIKNSIVTDPVQNFIILRDSKEGVSGTGVSISCWTTFA